MLCWDEYIYGFGASALGWGSPRLQNLELCGKGPWPNSDTLGFGKQTTVSELLLTGATDNFDTVGFPSEINCFDAGLGSPSAEPGPPLADPAAFGPVLRKGGAAQGRYSGFRRQTPLY